jgi:hypothetical protein
MTEQIGSRSPMAPSPCEVPFGIRKVHQNLEERKNSSDTTASMVNSEELSAGSGQMIRHPGLICMDCVSPVPILFEYRFFQTYIFLEN